MSSSARRRGGGVLVHTLSLAIPRPFGLVPVPRSSRPVPVPVPVSGSILGNVSAPLTGSFLSFVLSVLTLLAILVLLETYSCGSCTDDTGSYLAYPTLASLLLGFRFRRRRRSVAMTGPVPALFGRRGVFVMQVDGLATVLHAGNHWNQA